MAKEPTKEIATVEATLPTDLQGSWGSAIDSEDIILPRILLMQPMSELVSEKELADPGDIVKSTNEEILGNRDKPVRFFPITTFKTWVIYETTSGKSEFRRVEPMTGGDSQGALEWTEGTGKDLKSFSRDKVINAYVLLEEDYKNAANGSGACLPCLVSFRRTSYMSGRKLTSGIAESHFLKRPAAERIYELRSAKRTSDKGTYYVWDIAPVAKSDLPRIQLAKQWFDTLPAAKVHDINDA